MNPNLYCVRDTATIKATKCGLEISPNGSPGDSFTQPNATIPPVSFGHFSRVLFRICQILSLTPDQDDDHQPLLTTFHIPCMEAYQTTEIVGNSYYPQIVFEKDEGVPLFKITIKEVAHAWEMTKIFQLFLPLSICLPASIRHFIRVLAWHVSNTCNLEDCTAALTKIDALSRSWNFKPFEAQIQKTTNQTGLVFEGKEELIISKLFYLEAIVTCDIVERMFLNK